jgi:hypothetical protein
MRLAKEGSNSTNGIERGSMTNTCIVVLILAMLFVGPDIARLVAQETGSYPNGSEGIRPGSLPPPGVYWRNYFFYYHAGKLMDSDGNEIPIGFKANVFAWTQRIIWVSHLDILSGNYGINVVIPLVTKDISVHAARISDGHTGIGDIVLDQFIRWGKADYDMALGFAIAFPTGSYDKNRPGLAGQNFVTYMLTYGLTYYLDDEKSWAVGVLPRYEIHGAKGNEDVRPGNDFHFEWSISKNIEKVWEVGIVGFCQWQATSDQGAAAVNPSVHDRSFAVGPEVDLVIPSIGLLSSLHYEQELGVIDRPQGSIVVLTLTKVL